MVGLLFFSAVAAIAANRHAISLRPLRIYAQDIGAAKEAAVALSLYFNVSLHYDPRLSCDQLISTAQKFHNAASVVIVSKKSGRCPKDLWLAAFMVDVSSGNATDWQSYVKQLNQNSEVPTSQLYRLEDVHSSSPGGISASSTTTAKAAAGLLIPSWVLVLAAIVVVLLLIAVAVLGWMTWKKNDGKGEESATKDTKPEEVSMKTVALKKPESSMKSTEKSTTKKSKSSKRSDRMKRRSDEKSSTSQNSKTDTSSKNPKEKKEEERSDAERSRKAQTKKTADHPKDGGSEICQLRSDQAELHIPEPLPPPQRILEKRLEEPMTKEEFLYNMLKLTKQMVEYCEDSLIYPVTTTEKPGFIFKRLQGEVPREPGNLQTIQEMTDFIKTTILPGMTHWQHPRFHSYFACGRSYPDILAEMLLASLGVAGSTWEACPALVEMEYAMVNWVGKALGLPEIFLFKENIGQSIGGGSFVETSTEAILSTVMAARQWKIRELTKKDVGHVGPGGAHYDFETMHEVAKKLVFYASKEAHSAMEKSCKMAMVRCRSVPTDESSKWGMTAIQLERDILQDKKRGLVPTFVLVTLGTISSGASDDLVGVVEVAKKHGLYVHVDAATCGMFWIDPKYQANCKGLEMANSLNVSLHKAMLQSASSAILFTRDKKILLDAMAVTPKHVAAEADVVDLRDWGMLSSRKFKALKTWFVLKFYGMDGIRRYLKNAVEMSDYFLKKVEAHPNLKVFSHSLYGQFCFQYVGEKGWTREQINVATTQLAKHLNQSTKILVTHAKIGENNVIRISTSFERTPKWSVDDNFSTMCDLIDEFKHTKTQQQQLPANVVECGPLYPGLNRPRMPGDDDRGLIGSANLVTDRTRYSTSEMTSASPKTAVQEPPFDSSSKKKQLR